MIDRGEFQMDFNCGPLGWITLDVGYTADIVDGGDHDLEIRYVRSEAGQDVDTPVR